MITGKEAAQFAVKIILRRLVTQALVGLVAWEDAVISLEQVLQEARLFLKLLLTRNGHTRSRKGRVVVVRAVGDASDRDV